MTLLKYWREALFGVFCLVTLIQLLYYALLFTRLAFYTRKAKLQNQQQPLSVVICARDEANNLVKNLPGVLVQQYPTTHEIVLVNDNSHDDTRYLVDELRKTFKNLVPIELTQEAKMIAGKNSH